MSSGVFHGGGISAAAEAYGIEASRWLDLSTGINPCPPELPPLDASVWHRLPDHDLAANARLAAQAYYQSGGNLPILAAGTQPLIRGLARLAGGQGARVAILSPTYGEYRAVFRAAEFAVDEITGLGEITADHAAVVIVNPNNPTGRVFSRADLLALAFQLSGRDTLLIVDEAFGDIEPARSLAGAVDHHPHLAVLKSFGKFFGFAGLRLSAAIAGEAYAAPLEESLGPWPVSGPALAIAAAFYQADPAPVREGIRARFIAMRDLVHRHGLKLAGNAELFLLIETPDAAALHEHLCRCAILTRKFDYRLDWLRIGQCANAAELARLDEALAAWRTTS